MKTERYLQMARNMALMSDFEKYQVGCIVVYKKAIIGAGFNCNKTHPLQMEYNKLRFQNESTPQKLHAEMHALLPIKYMDIDWSKVKLYIYRMKRDNEKKRGMARPCVSCMAFIKSRGIKEVFYTTDIGYAHEMIV